MSRGRVPNTAVGGTDIEELANHMKAANERPTASLTILEPTKVDEQQHLEEAAAAWIYEHLPTGMAVWQAHKRIRQQRQPRTGLGTGHRPLTRDTLWDRDAHPCSERPGRSARSNGQPLRSRGCAAGATSPLVWTAQVIDTRFANVFRTRVKATRYFRMVGPALATLYRSGLVRTGRV